MAAFFWGLACFLPIGVVYLAASLLILALYVDTIRSQSKFVARCRRVYQHTVFWPLCFFTAWTLLILGIQPHFAETPSNLFHASRIVATIIFVLLLDSDELRAALIGWILGCLLVLAIIYINTVMPLPQVPGLRDILNMRGNKSIGICVLLAIFASLSFIYSLKKPVDEYQGFAILGLLLVLPVLIWFLPSRTSLVLIFFTLVIGLSHYFRHKPAWLFSTLAVISLLGIALSQTPQVQKRFAQGLNELSSSQATENTSQSELDNSSWRMRYLLYTHTIQMIADKPAFGWGIGSWNVQWRNRTPSHLHAANMPHNDFLWAGSQAGLPAAISLLAMMLSLALNVFRRRGLAATFSLMATSGLFVAMSFNSALRDAQIGMSVLFVVVAINAWALTQTEDRAA